MESPTPKNILTVIVLYKITLDESKSFQSILRDVQKNVYKTKPRLILYDNSPQGSEDFKKYEEYFDFTYIHDTSNPGVSKAYNVASTIAVRENREWILLLDQDTLSLLDFYKPYLKAISQFPNIMIHCPMLSSDGIIYSPCNYYLKRGFFWKGVRAGVTSMNKKSILNSGMLVNLAAYVKTGGFNERVKLYFSDFEFLDRFRKNYKEFYVIPVIFQHELSDKTYTDANKAVVRFKYYTEGARYSVTSIGDYISYFLTVGLRACKLSLSFRNVEFLKLFLKRFLGKS